MANYFITGATGFIGEHLIGQLLDEGNNLCCLARIKHPAADKYPSVAWVYGDLLDPECYAHHLRKADYVIHLAGIVTARRQEDYYRVNVEGTRILLRTCRDNSRTLKRFLYMSSIAALGPKSENSLLMEDDPPRPETIYGKSKLLAEWQALEYISDLPIGILRPTFVYGPGDLRGLKFLKLLSEQSELLSFNIIEAASLCYVSDLVAASIQALTAPIPSGAIFHISDAQVYTWRQVNSILKQVVGELCPELTDNNFIFKRSFNDREENPGDISSPRPSRQFWGCSIDKAGKLIGFRPRYTLLSGARETIRWYRDYNLYSNLPDNEPGPFKGRFQI